MMSRLSLYEPFNEVFPELFRRMVMPDGDRKEAEVAIRVDLSESDDKYQVVAEVPGVNKEDIKVDIDRNRVSIWAEVKKNVEEKEDDRVLRTERYYGSASRSFAFESEIDDANAKASYKDGVLTLELPKAKSAASKRLSIA